MICIAFRLRSVATAARVVATVALLLFGVACVACQRGASAPLHLIILSIDTLRADHVHSYGYGPETSPEIDRLAREGALFEQAVAETSWTLPAHVTMFSGASSRAHGVSRDDRAVGSDLPLLAESLRDAGYETAGLWSGPYLHPIFGLGRGFDRYEGFAGDTAWDDPGFLALELGDQRETKREAFDAVSQRAVTSPALVDRALEILAEERERPLFLFVHFFDVHGDYVPPEEDWRRFDPDYRGVLTGRDLARNPLVHSGMPRRDLEHLVALYDGEIRFTDRHVGRLLDGLARIGLRERTLVVLTADHGEEFLDHAGVGHRRTLFEEMLRVPLIVRMPGTPAGRRIPGQVSHLDLMPTLLELLEVPGPADGLGRSFAAAVRGEGPVPESASVSRLEVPGRGIWTALRRPGSKLVVTEQGPRGAPPQFLLDLGSDPAEQRPILGPPARLAEARRELDRFRAREDAWIAKRGESSLPLSVPAALREQLEALGYVEESEPGSRPTAGSDGSDDR